MSNIIYDLMVGQQYKTNDGRTLTITAIVKDEIRNGRLLKGGRKITVSDGSKSGDYYEEIILDLQAGGKLTHIFRGIAKNGDLR